MATVTIRNLGDDVRDALKARGAEHGRSMEGEARAILTAATRSEGDGSHGTDLVQRIRSLFADADWPGVERASDRPVAPVLDAR